MVDEAKLTAAYKRVEAMQRDIEVMLGEAGDHLLCKGSNTTITDLVNAYHSFLTQLAEALGDRIDAAAGEAKVLRKAKTEAEKRTEVAEKKADEVVLPEGTMVVGGEKPNELTVMVLRKADRATLKRILEVAKKFLAGGTDDIKRTLSQIAQARKMEHWSGRRYGYAGYPKYPSVVVVKSDESGKLTKAATPDEEKPQLADLDDYLRKAAKLHRNVSVELT